MTDLFLGKVRQIDAAIKDVEKHIEGSQQHILKMQAEIVDYHKQRQEIIYAKDFCESVLHQVRAALAMLHKVDSEQVRVFENAIKAQFKLDPNTLREEDYWQEVTNFVPDFKVTNSLKAIPLTILNSPTFTGTPIAPKVDVEFVRKTSTWQFEIIQEKFALVGIRVGYFYYDSVTEKRWFLYWNEETARLVWLAEKGWTIEPVEEGDQELKGQWCHFDIDKFLRENGVDPIAWAIIPPFSPTSLTFLEALDVADGIFTEIKEQQHFKIIREKFDLAGIKIKHCFMNRPESKRWLIEWKGEEAKLVWEEDEGWEVESMDEDNDELTGEWTRFSLPKFLRASGVDTYSWYSHSWGS